MTRIGLAVDVLDDLDRFVDHVASFDGEYMAQRIEDLLAAVQVLEHSPQIGRPVKRDKRELVIGSGARVHVALYRYVQAIDAVFVLAVRARREVI